MFVTSNEGGFRAAVGGLRSFYEEGRKFPNLHAPGGRLSVGFWSRTSVRVCQRASSERSSIPWTFMSMESHSCVTAVSGHRQKPPSQPPTSLYRWRGSLKSPKCDKSPNSSTCECRWSRTWPQKAHCNETAGSGSDTRRVTAVKRHDASSVGVPNSTVDAVPRGSSLSAVAVGSTTRRTTGFVRCEGSLCKAITPA
jgi:hypothetical protein